MLEDNITKLPRQPLRPDKEPGQEIEIWQPCWRCFCCQDPGNVANWLVRSVIPDYDNHRDKLVACQRSGCTKGEYYLNNENYDQRFNAGLCAKLDALNRQSWQRTVLQKQLRIQEKANQLARHMSLRKRDRTSSEEMEVQRRHEEVCNADPNRLAAMAQEYLGQDYYKDGGS